MFRLLTSFVVVCYFLFMTKEEAENEEKTGMDVVTTSSTFLLCLLSLTKYCYYSFIPSSSFTSSCLLMFFSFEVLLRQSFCFRARAEEGRGIDVVWGRNWGKHTCSRREESKEDTNLSEKPESTVYITCSLFQVLQSSSSFHFFSSIRFLWFQGENF